MLSLGTCVCFISLDIMFYTIMLSQAEPKYQFSL